MPAAARPRLAIPTTDPTRYEVAVYIHGQLAKVLGYTARASRQGLLAYFNDASPVVRAAYGAGELTEADVSAPATYSRAQGLVMGQVRLAFTGRTERDAAA